MTRAPGARTLSLGSVHYIFAAVLLVRMVALLRLTGSPLLLPTRGDMHFYNDWAQRILHGQLTDHLAFYGLPLYAYLLAAIYKLFGYGPFLPALLQAALDAGTAVLIYKVARRCFSSSPSEETQSTSADWILRNRGALIGATAAAGWAFFVPAQAYSVVLMPTAWLVFVFWFLVWQVVEHGESPALHRALGWGLLVGFTAMGIATILFIVPLLAAAIFLRAGSGGAGRRAAALAVLIAGIAIGTSPCWLHNNLVAGDRVFLSAHSGVNFWIGNNPIANGYPRFPPGLRAGQAAMLQDSIAAAEEAAGRPLPRSEVSAFWAAKARAYIRDNPGRWLRLLGRKFSNFWNAFQYDDLSIITNLRAQQIIWPGLQFGAVAAFGLAGMLVTWSQRRSRWIAAAILLHAMSLMSVFVTERYRLAAVPGLLLFAAAGLWRLWHSCIGREYRPAGIYFAALVCTTAFVSAPQTNPALWALDAYNSGWQALESGNSALAQKKLELARAYVPDNAEINFALGNLWLERRDFGRAEAFYRETLKLDPEHRSAPNNLGVLHLQAGNWDLAAQQFRSALQRDPRNPKTHYLLGKAAAGANDLATALAAARRAAEINPGEPEFAAFVQELENRRSGAP